MNKQTQSLYKDLLSLHGHVTDPVEFEAAGFESAEFEAGRQEATPRRRRNGSRSWFADFLLLGGHDPIDPHLAGDAIVAPDRPVVHC